MVGVVLRVYRPGKDRDRIPHRFADALVEWPNGVTNYEYQHGLSIVVAH